MREQSFMKSLFFGVIDESLIFPWPEPQAQEVDALRTLLDGVRRYFHLWVDSANIDREQRIPDEVLARPEGARALRDAGAAEPRGRRA